MLIATVILLALTVYAGVGVIVGLGFVILGISTVDHAARGAGAPWHFRLLILPGAAALWPFVIRWWIVASRAPRGAVP
jgi:hypothetical protein